MRLAFFASEKEREQELASAVLAGARKHGHKGQIRLLGDNPDLTGYDIGCFVGVKSKRLFRAHRAAGIQFLMLDKAYIRHRDPANPSRWEYWRVSVNDHHPTAYLESHRFPSDRFDALGLEVAPWKTDGETIIIAGSSEKYHAFYDLGDPNDYARDIVRMLREFTDRPIIYRPKPSWRGAVEIEGARLSPPKEELSALLANAACLITHGSNACFEAMLAGVPSIILGNAVARPISSTSLSEVENPLRLNRKSLLNGLAYHQYTLAEHRSGAAWEIIGGIINANSGLS